MPTPSRPNPPALDLLSVLTGTTPDIAWLVPDVLPSGSLIALAGEPGSGKSFLAYTLSLALCTGTTFLGIPLTAKRVLYFDSENSPNDRDQYLRWAWHGLRCPHTDAIVENFTVAPFILGTKEWAMRAHDYVVAYQPNLIIIDTTTPACAIEDENDNAEAHKAINAIRQLQTLLPSPPAVLALKHAKVRAEDGTYTLRGAKAWEGAVDGVMFQVKDRGAPRADGLRNTHLQPAKTRAFGLREIIKIRPEWINDRGGLRLHRG